LISFDDVKCNTDLISQSLTVQHPDVCQRVETLALLPSQGSTIVRKRKKALCTWVLHLAFVLKVSVDRPSV